MYCTKPTENAAINEVDCQQKQNVETATSLNSSGYVVSEQRHNVKV